MQTGENSIMVTRIYCIVLLFAVKYKFMTLWLNTTINTSTLIWNPPFNLTAFKF